MQYNPAPSSENSTLASTPATQRCSQRRYNMAEPLKPYIDQYLDNHDLPEEEMEDGAQLFNLAADQGDVKARRALRPWWDWSKQGA